MKYNEIRPPKEYKNTRLKIYYTDTYNIYIYITAYARIEFWIRHCRVNTLLYTKSCTRMGTIRCGIETR